MSGVGVTDLSCVEEASLILPGLYTSMISPRLETSEVDEFSQTHDKLSAKIGATSTDQKKPCTHLNFDAKSPSDKTVQGCRRCVDN